MASDEGEFVSEEINSSDTKVHLSSSSQQNNHYGGRHCLRLNEPFQLHGQNSRYSPRVGQHRPRWVQNWRSGGSGMQAIFLDSGQKSCGTGVFLPQRAGTNVSHPSNKKPGCAPVLLPFRVVQALNLNVQPLGQQVSVSPRQEYNKSNIRNLKERDCISVKNKKGKDVARRPQSCYVIDPQNQNNSPELFLPKEWTY